MGESILCNYGLSELTWLPGQAFPNLHPTPPTLSSMVLSVSHSQNLATVASLPVLLSATSLNPGRKDCLLSQSKHLTQSLMPWRCSGKAVEGRRQASKEHWRVPALTLLSDPGSRLSARLPWPRWQHLLSQRNRRALKALWSHQPGRRNHQW